MDRVTKLLTDNESQIGASCHMSIYVLDLNYAIQTKNITMIYITIYFSVDLYNKISLIYYI